MNKEWSELNKRMQSLIRKSDTFEQGKDVLFELRNDLMNTLLSFRKELNREDFDSMPFMNADGYHSKNIAYSIWHIFRIEDIVAHTLINGDPEILFSGNYQCRINSPITTTGNELVKEHISDFTRKLDIDELYSYIAEVKKSTEEIIRNLTFSDLKIKVSDEQKENLKINKVYAQCDINNPASFGVMRKIGMTCIDDQGTRTYPRTGKTSGEYTCLITREEWGKAKRMS